jgi:hypothetical protein
MGWRNSCQVSVVGCRLSVAGCRLSVAGYQRNRVRHLSSRPERSGVEGPAVPEAGIHAATMISIHAVGLLSGGAPHLRTGVEEPGQSEAEGTPKATIGREIESPALFLETRNLKLSSYTLSIFTEFNTTSLFGLSWRLRGSLVILSATSWPSTTSPKMV